MDTNYFQQAVDEYALKRSSHIKVGDLTMGELSWLLRRAQELKVAAAAGQFEARRGTCAWCGRRDFSEHCDSPLGHKLYENVHAGSQLVEHLLELEHPEEIR